MPVNYQEIQGQVRAMGQQAQRLERERDDRFRQANELLDLHANDLDGLRSLVEQAAEQYTNLRCARPLSEPLTYVFGPPPPSDTRPVLLAADGSQANPSRHDMVEFGLINVGVFRICPGQALVPQERVFSKLLYEEDFDGEQEPLNEETIAMRRDLRERQILADLSANEGQPVITLTDGTLELFHEPREDRYSQRQHEEYLDALERMASMNVATAGDVDKPRAYLVVRVLELQMLRDRLEAFGRERPLRGVTDDYLFRSRLQPGQRTAVFALQFKTAERFAARLGGRMALNFFYLNVGHPQHPALARVEVPAWVAIQPWLLTLLHCALLEQCEVTGGRPYPYALHRAHEIALISFGEKQQLSDLIVSEFYRQGVQVGIKSNKQFHKDLPGRTRR
jgi:hypothetical protein